MKSFLTVLLILLLNTCANATELSEAQIIGKVQETYQQLENFSCNGSIKTTQYINDFPLHKYITEFSIKLKKPNYYLIQWVKKDPEEEKIMTEGAVWNDGTGSYVYDKSLALLI